MKTFDFVEWARNHPEQMTNNYQDQENLATERYERLELADKLADAVDEYEWLYRKDWVPPEVIEGMFAALAAYKKSGAEPRLALEGHTQ
jgi:hypothetical protein